jgi:murein DD-endopeptidase MepM/ murein hydrolase activator NlpD
MTSQRAAGRGNEARLTARGERRRRRRWRSFGLLVGAVCGALLAVASAAEARPRISVKPTAVKQGDVVLVTVRGLAPARGEGGGGDRGDEPTVRFGDRRFELQPTRDGLVALLPVPLDAKPGPATITLATERGEAREEAITREITIAPRERREVALEVDEVFVYPPASVRTQMRQDDREIARAYAEPRARSADAPRIAGRFAWPRPPRVTAPYGDVRVFNGDHRSDHLGVDLAGAEGAPVRAAHDGVVVLSREAHMEGRMVLVSHGAGLFTGYFHLRDADVQEGDRVRKGERIGRVGASGRTTGPHLHWAVRANGRYVDPEAFMRLGWSPRPLPEESDRDRREAGPSEPREDRAAREPSRQARRPRPR